MKAAAYRAGKAVGQTQMAGGMQTTQCVDGGGATLLQTAKHKAAQIGMTTPDLIARIVAFHDERLDAVPDLTVYPELAGEREVLLARYRGMADAGMSRELIALNESLKFWCDYRCRTETGCIPHGGPLPPEQRERCRVLYAPETDRGPLHFKNVDDPLHSWKPMPETFDPGPWPFSPLAFDGVGSGLHIDDAPPEIFPADAVSLAKRYCSTVPEAEEFLIRYNYFWASANLLVHDENGYGVAIDKSSRCQYAIRRQGSNGVLYINGMSSFDDAYQTMIETRRKQYLIETGQDETTPEGAYFRFAEGTLRNMKRRMADFERNPTEASLIEHFSSRDPDGPLCRPGKQHHPDDPIRAATLFQRCYYLSDRVMKWRQWHDNTPVWEDAWKTVEWNQ